MLGFRSWNEVLAGVRETGYKISIPTDSRDSGLGRQSKNRNERSRLAALLYTFFNFY